MRTSFGFLVWHLPPSLLQKFCWRAIRTIGLLLYVFIGSAVFYGVLTAVGAKHDLVIYVGGFLTAALTVPILRTIWKGGLEIKDY